MDAKEKKMIQQICRNLENSTRTTWYDGNVHKWAEFAKSMKSAINNSVSILETLSDEDPENDILSEEDFLAKNLE